MAKTSKKPAAKMGRPSLYNERLADRICALIADGSSLRSICERPGFPDRGTVMRWQREIPSFATKCAQAREDQAELMDEKILDVADACTPETAAADRVKISAYQWRASKLKPKVYGDKIQSEISGPDGKPIETVELTPREAAQRAAFLLAKGAKAK